MKRTGIALTLAIIAALPAYGRKSKKSLLDEVTRHVERKLDETLVPAPADNEVCFTPGEPCDIKLWKFFQSAKSSLDIAVYDLTHPKLTHEILVASKRIPVRVIVDRRQAKGEHSLVDLLVKGGAQVRLGRQRGIMHHKFAVVDNARVQTGSFNYTSGAVEKNQENQLYLSERGIVDRYRARFAQMWNESKPLTASLSKKD